MSRLTSALAGVVAMLLLAALLLGSSVKSKNKEIADLESQISTLSNSLDNCNSRVEFDDKTMSDILDENARVMQIVKDFVSKPADKVEYVNENNTTIKVIEHHILTDELDGMLREAYDSIYSNPGTRIPIEGTL